LKTRSKQLAGALSGGERQMLVGIISGLNDAGISIKIVEQNADFALKIAHHGYVMERGKIVPHGNTTELLTNDFVRKAYLGI
jgi:branched-chain amino acid transport system ATP-binding protein